MSEPTNDMHQFLELAYAIDCSRCANSQIYEIDHPIQFAAAIEAFEQAGWTVEYPRVFCPSCNGETWRGRSV